MGWHLMARREDRLQGRARTDFRVRQADGRLTNPETIMSQTKDKQPVSTLLSWRNPTGGWMLEETDDGESLRLERIHPGNEVIPGLTDADLEAIESLLRVAIRHRKRAGKGAGPSRG